MKFFKKKFSKKRNIRVILIHGFGIRTIDEMTYVKNFLSNKGYDVVVPKLFDVNDEEDTDWLKWVSRARIEFENAKKDGKEIYVIGYSMGGVIATYLSTIFDVEKLVLLAPAFDYKTLTTAKRSVVNLFNNEKKEISLSMNAHFAFMNLVDELGKNIEILKCPVLMIQGSTDLTIPQTVAKKAYKKIPHDKKKLVIIEDGTHRLMDERLTQDILNCLILDFYIS